MRPDKKIIFIFSVLILTSFLSGAAFETKEDSLKRVLQTTEIDSEKV
jgi:hypothetical protein